jgi:tRNA(Ile)-lysidine synthase
MRGSGLTGLSGIPPKREFGRDAVIIRPFLNVTRDEIEKYVSIRKLFWVEDITNRSLDFTRNKIRHTVIPELAEKFNPKLVETLHRTTQILRGADIFLSKQIEEHAKLAMDEYKEGSLLIKKGILNSYTDFVKGEVIQHLLTKHFDLTPLPSKQLDKISELPNTSIGSKAEVSKEILAINQRDTILISDFVERETNTEPVFIREEGEFLLGDYKYQVTYMDAEDIKLVPDSDIEYFDVEYMPQSLTLRYWADGDRISPLGMDGTTKVSDYLTNEKIEPGERPNIAVFFDGVEVIWICGMRVSDKYKISNKTKKVMRVERSEIVVEDKEN